MNKGPHPLTLLFASVLGLSFLSACNRTDEPVRIQGGLVSGARGADPSIKIYKGIPFAQPPVGDLRWKEPQPPKPWQGVRKADSLPPACVQNVVKSRLPWTEEYMHQGETSEDCLYLNIWTGAAAVKEKRPVMVYVYGGGFTEGSNAVAVYDGEELAGMGAVIVVMNYRLGPLGFLAHPELSAESAHHTSGNYGLMDQAAALRWIRDNIEAFGGDPQRVTVFGQSAGAMSVSALLESPQAQGLFARAIIQSGPGLLPPSILSGSVPLDKAEENGARFAAAMGAASLADLRAIPPEKLIGGAGSVRFGTVIDGWFLPEKNSDKGPLPLINGFTADDLGVDGGFGSPPPATVEAYEGEARKLYGDEAGAFLSLYPANSDAGVPALRKAAAQDRARISLYLWASKQAAAGSSVYTYYFDRAIPWPDHPEFGAFHSGELPYVFNNLKIFDRPWETTDYAIANQISRYWINFAERGDPNGPGLQPWPDFNPSQPVTMRLGARMGAMPIADPAETAFWKRILAAPDGQ